MNTVNVVLVSVAAVLVALIGSFCLGAIVKRIRDKQIDITACAVYGIISIGALVTAVRLVSTLLRVI